ncbi:hypothetical protein [Haliscomenobacter hydrossis]|uniref:DUF2007 domain-containing protein n=1 Tax=Haliscomenobacter hydrossis (strain ATCC 27775 / DSM 1100 / LMG 10767 / O) TaxID=760192 RepID=F4KRZ4_HALH1|nr:hypothetical protein [Haliscomenobacter hydrossis]AEE51081.1 hypothetical protein Halhy_3221 [Haliscomenobacter hydrossis DSM 1100]
MPSDEILDDLQWENQPEEDENESLEEDYDEQEGFDTDTEVVCIKRFTFSWNAQVAALILRNHHIPHFLNNVLINDMMQLQSSQVELIVRKEDAGQVLDLLADIDQG